jgi:hypothetical protein
MHVKTRLYVSAQYLEFSNTTKYSGISVYVSSNGAAMVGRFGEGGAWMLPSYSLVLKMAVVYVKRR